MGFFTRNNQNSSSSEETQVEKALEPKDSNGTASNPAGDDLSQPQRNHNGHLVSTTSLCYVKIYF